MDYEIVIGLEVHLQLSTESKIFCASSTTFGSDPNTHIDPVTFGLPGALPVPNKKVVEFAIMMGLALHCEIRKLNRFARKHYFYPDLPKGYQISQFDEPICEHGNIRIQSGETTRTVGITRIHMEEDAGKSIHDPKTASSLVDLNRAGVPLLEIVSEPDIRSASEASAYLKSLRQIARYLGISDGNMEEGSLRCDANVSLRPKGELKFGTRTELKNINSFKFVERAIEYEVARQLSLLKNGEEVVQETRLFDSTTGATKSMRSKEESAEYRYFPDPDLPPLVIEESWIHALRAKMPKLPEERFTELVETFGLTEYDAGVLTAEKSFIDYFLAVVDVCKNPKAAANWITSELFAHLHRESLPIEELHVAPEQLGKLLSLIDEEVLSGRMAKEVFEEMCASGREPEEIIEERGLKQLTDDNSILELIRTAFDDHPDQLAQFLEGEEKLQGFFVGQVMKASQGTANPKKVNEILRAETLRRQNKGS
ncbi:MAG: Asp-tRNA(Asn)/Glu-tRNA(Gln) amidotransferase subunit GatB [Bdellovibrionales bacterium]|nr:Asp-tRNA(Asn)/Glu-tRNA(Gln) amidotransferase subunit GatB [Bdellovibrionales bacterium]